MNPKQTVALKGGPECGQEQLVAGWWWLEAEVLDTLPREG